ncbi:hypothetical protein [Blastococcus sp. TF02A-35]|uniref:hypothetical protein n=1 Tax=Blastococcus sp. TF02A-35 TaxID=2559612 RepID=UPI0010730D36|nr:hypothetical protein [Blastococcus sp. TF02A_35]TFV44383.1 hypothetical protein E4P43_18835 [Blastococcus sp. TF02A_35]
MTALQSPAPTTDRPIPARDHRPSANVRGLTVVAGGALFAVGNLLHPLEHNDTAHESPTWVAAHVVFAIGALLIAAGMTVLTRRFRSSPTGLVGLGITWLGMVLIPGGALMEAYVRPLFDHHGFGEIEQATILFTMVAGTSNLLGPALIAIGAIRNRLLPLWAALAIPGITVGRCSSRCCPRRATGSSPAPCSSGSASPRRAGCPAPSDARTTGPAPSRCRARRHGARTRTGLPAAQAATSSTASP